MKMGFNYIAALEILSFPEVIIRMDEASALFHVITKDGEFIGDLLHIVIKQAYCASEWAIESVCDD